VTVSRYRKQRGHETETAVATYLRGHGWPHAEPVGAGRQGADITGTPGLAIEVKARRDLKLTAWLKQAGKGLGAWPMVVHRPDGYGPEKVADWPVTMRLADVVAMLRQAGYGDEEA